MGIDLRSDTVQMICLHIVITRMLWFITQYGSNQNTRKKRIIFKPTTIMLTLCYNKMLKIELILLTWHHQQNLSFFCLEIPNME